MVPKSSSVLSRVLIAKFPKFFIPTFLKDILAGYGILGSVTFFQNFEATNSVCWFCRKISESGFSLLKISLFFFPLDMFKIFPLYL